MKRCAGIELLGWGTALLIMALSRPLAASSASIVISQVYGDGGNAASTFRSDFVELFNRGDTPVNMTGWSIQYSTANGPLWQSTILSGSIAPGQYFLVRQADGAAGRFALPPPDAVGDINLDPRAGKVALLSTSATTSGTCPSGSVIDFVAYGGASCSEGSPAASPGADQALSRVPVCQDSDVNVSDFKIGAPNPRNAATSVSPCPELAASAASQLIFPLVADGGGYRTTLLMTNASNLPVTVTVTFWTSAGEPWTLTIDNTTTNLFSVNVPVRGSIRLQTSGQPAAGAVGWARVVASPAADFNGTALFQLFNGTTLAAETSVAAGPPVSNADFFVDENDGVHTGIALANAGKVAAVGTLTVADSAGSVTATYSIRIAPGNGRAVFISELIPKVNSGRAELSLTAGSLAVAALRVNSNGLLSTLSVGPGVSSSVYFSPNGGARARVITEINRAQTTLDVAISSFTSVEMLNALVSAKSRGVTIRLVADAAQAAIAGSQISALEQLGFSLKRLAPSGGAMHDSYAIVDAATLITGSYNWSTAAEEVNFENMIVIRNASVVQSYMSDFEAIWSRK